MQIFYDYFNQHVSLSAADRSPWIIGMAVVQTLIGLVYLLWGWRIFNIVVMLQAAIFGAILGAFGAGLLGTHLGFSSGVTLACMAGGAVVTAAALVVIAKYLYRFLFAIQAGFFAAAVLVVALGETGLKIQPVVAFIGAVIVLIATAVLVYRKFAVTVMAVMSLQGAVLTVAGVSMLIAAALESNHAVRPTVALIAVAVLATPSFLYQRSRGQVMGQKATTGGKSRKSSSAPARRKAA
jgi:hypothetical protein